MDEVIIRFIWWNWGRTWWWNAPQSTKSSPSVLTRPGLFPLLRSVDELHLLPGTSCKKRRHVPAPQSDSIRAASRKRASAARHTAHCENTDTLCWPHKSDPSPCISWFPLPALMMESERLNELSDDVDTANQISLTKWLESTTQQVTLALDPVMSSGCRNHLEENP